MTHLSGYIAGAIGWRIRQLRRARGLSQGHLARRVKSHREIVARVERGQHCPSIRTVNEYAAALGVPAWAIVSAIDDMPYATAGRQLGEERAA